MKLRPDEITKVLREQIEQYQGRVDVEEVGTVRQVGDGIARGHGLQPCVALEMLELPHGARLWQLLEPPPAHARPALEPRGLPG